MSEPIATLGLMTLSIADLKQYIAAKVADGDGVWVCFCQKAIVVIKPHDQIVIIHSPAMSVRYEVTISDPELFEKVTAATDKITDIIMSQKYVLRGM